MLLHIKYEYRKNLTLYIILFSLLIGMELLAVASILSGSEVFMSLALVAVFFWGLPCMVMFFFIFNVISFARELNSKSSYMTFMTPVSPYAIMGARYISLFATTIAVLLLFIGFGFADMQISLVRFPELTEYSDIMMILFDADELTSFLATLAAGLTVSFLFVCTVMCLLFFSITLSRTILETKKGKGGLSVAFLAGLLIVTFVAMRFLPQPYYGRDIYSNILAAWPRYLFLLCEIAGSYVGCSVLLDKKLSL